MIRLQFWTDQVTHDSILSLMRRKDYQPCKMKELAKALGVPQTGYRGFRRLVQELEAEGRILRLRHNRFGLPRDSDQVVGRLRVHPRGFGFVVAAEREVDLYIPRGCLGAALEGDLVCARVLGEDAQGRGPEGRVVDVVRQAAQSYVGTVAARGRRLVVVVDDPRLERDIFLADQPSLQLHDGLRVVVRITARGWGYDGLRGEVTEVLGEVDDPSLDYLTVIHRFDLAVNFLPAAVEEQQALQQDLSGEFQRRADLRDLCCLTIDPQEARDFDDAISLARRAGGGYRLGVHIADVSHYVRPETALDREALARGTSTYLLDHVIHMLPERLAVDLCSLRPGEDRLALSVLVELDEGARVTDFSVAESVVRSAGRLSYEQVQLVLDGQGAADQGMPWADLLQLMRELSHKRYRLRMARGALDLDVPEPRVDLDGHGCPCRLGWHERLESHRLVEECMLVANECVGRYAAENGLPVVYRVHLPPAGSKLQRLAAIVPGLNPSADGEISPRQVQRWLQAISSREDAAVLRKLLLQALMQAEYAAVDRGHFALACRQYLHFTSPIRRYPDLLVHRAVKAALQGEVDTNHREEALRELHRIASWTSRCERRAEMAERTYRTMKQLRYMEGFLGEEFDGVVSGVIRGGCFVELGGLGAQGFCPVRGLDDSFRFDERRRCLIGCRTRRAIRIGATVHVRVLGVDWNAQQMELELLNLGRWPARRAKKGRRPASRRQSSRRLRR